MHMYMCMHTYMCICVDVLYLTEQKMMLRRQNNVAMRTLRQTLRRDLATSLRRDVATRRCDERCDNLATQSPIHSSMQFPKLLRRCDVPCAPPCDAPCACLRASFAGPWGPNSSPRHPYGSSPCDLATDASM